MQFVGYPLQFDPQDIDRSALRKKFGYGEEKVVLCTVGGTSVGRPLIELCIRAYPITEESVPGLKMVLALGPHLGKEGLPLPPGIEALGYEPMPYERMAAADLIICSGGSTTTLELTTLCRPFLYFPLLNHFEQREIVASRCERFAAGVRMDFARTTPQSLAEEITRWIGGGMEHRPMRLDGAKRAAEMTQKLL
jgi:predicted glycosyltransferase